MVVVVVVAEQQQKHNKHQHQRHGRRQEHDKEDDDHDGGSMGEVDDHVELSASLPHRLCHLGCSIDLGKSTNIPIWHLY